MTGRHRTRPRSRAGWAACLLLASFGAVALIRAPRADILTTIEIAAPPDAVWSVLTDTRAYPTWNPLIAALDGHLVAGATIENVEGTGDDRVVFRPRVLVADADRELRWRGRLWGLPGLFVGEHYFLLRPTPRGTMFTQGEHFSGVLLWAFDPAVLVPRFEAMNVALAARVAHPGSTPAP